jgi:hypothetical protein
MTSLCASAFVRTLNPSVRHRVAQVLRRWQGQSQGTLLAPLFFHFCFYDIFDALFMRDTRLCSVCVEPFGEGGNVSPVFYYLASFIVCSLL